MQVSATHMLIETPENLWNIWSFLHVIVNRACGAKKCLMTKTLTYLLEFHLDILMSLIQDNSLLV